jgi:UDP-N-acetyl-2-amino-2-deoxyglucuronate dehydrogenase
MSSPSSAPVRLAIIGCGRIAGHHCRAIRATTGAEIVALCDLVADKSAAYGREFNVPAYTNYHEMMRNHPEINVVVVATPSGMHFEHSLDLLKRYQKHLIVEKPTFMRPSQLFEAYRTADACGVQLFPVFQNRHNHAVQRVLKALTDGELGQPRIVAVRLRWCRPQRYYDLSPWRGTFAQDGGAITNQGIHHIDLIRFLGGEVERVVSSMKTLGADIEVEDTVTAAVEFRNGATGVVEVTTAARPDDFEASISLVCEKGLAQIGGIAVNELQVFTPDPAACARHSEDFGRDAYGRGHLEVYKSVVSAVEGKTPFVVSREDCLSTLRLLHAFYRSAEQDRWVATASDEESPRLGKSDESLADLYRTPAP